MDITVFKQLARYHVWATARLNDTLKHVSIDHFTQAQGLFFQSILGTLNHLYVGESLWFARFNQLAPPQWRLNQIVLHNKIDLMHGLQEKAQQWEHFIDRVSVSLLQSDLNYRSSMGHHYCLPYGSTLLHVFNHATHHRGQVTAALTQLGYSCPEIDLVYMLVEEKSKA
ncbi:DinB family protein [Acinetobacter sp. B5B]|uniref:DinB family protein n=1 Tax=Acinetobacter baretiae TaxID=2605383 RepID=UPI0018C20AC3|nr:DinB family protein [Acinetobacter baretiae]MBF7682122.1 DinB family protein [Acinetobacter baretiae]